jgi:hypothetical protein
MADPTDESNGAWLTFDFDRRLRFGFQFDASAGDARGSRAVVADQPAREVDQDQRQGREAMAATSRPSTQRSSDVSEHTDVSEHAVFIV